MKVRRVGNLKVFDEYVTCLWANSIHTTALATGGYTFELPIFVLQIKLGDMPSLNNCVRLTYGHRSNPLKMFQPPCLEVGRNVRNSLRMFQDGNSRLAHNAGNLLNYFDYNESLELASNKHEQYSGSPEHQNCLGSAVIFKGCIKENQQRAVEVSTNFFGSCNGSAFLLYVWNQQHPVLDDGNRLSPGWSGNNASLRRSVTYKNFVGQRLCGTQRPARSLQVTKSYSLNALQSSMLLTTKVS